MDFLGQGQEVQVFMLSQCPLPDGNLLRIEQVTQPDEREKKMDLENFLKEINLYTEDDIFMMKKLKKFIYTNLLLLLLLH